MTVVATSERDHSRFGISLPLIFGLGVYAMIAAHGGAVLHDPDTYLHIAIGRWIIAHGAVPDHGIFSFTMPDAAWVVHEWLGEVALAWLYDHFGWTGLVVATALCASIALAMLLRLLLRTLLPVHALIATALAFALVIPHVLARPHIFTLPILVAWVAALVRARSGDRAPSPWLALPMVLWANLHGGYIFGLVLAGLLAGEAVLLAIDWRARLKAARGWGLFGVLAVGAALITPLGIDGLLLPLKLTQMSYALSQLTEWKSPNFQSFEPLELWIMIVFFAALSLGWRLPLTRLLMLLLLLHMALRHGRHGELLGFLAPLLLAPALAPLLSTSSPDRAVGRLDSIMAKLAKPASMTGIALAGLTFLAVSAAVLRGGATEPDIQMPTAALTAAEADHVKGPVLNDYGFGGYLIFSGIEPFIDGRAELYGDPFIKRYIEAMVLASDQLPQLLAEYGVTWTLISPSRPAVVLLDHLPGWRRLYADGIAVVHVRVDHAAR
jgi:hypothetical protein